MVEWWMGRKVRNKNWHMNDAGKKMLQHRKI